MARKLDAFCQQIAGSVAAGIARIRDGQYGYA
jgi:hypothetical protein